MFLTNAPDLTMTTFLKHEQIKDVAIAIIGRIDTQLCQLKAQHIITSTTESRVTNSLKFSLW